MYTIVLEEVIPILTQQVFILYKYNLLLTFLGQKWMIVETAIMSNNRKPQVMLILSMK